MLPYLVLAVLVGALSFLSEGVRANFTEHRVRNQPQPIIATPSRLTYFDYLAVAALVAFSALRSDVGTDYSTYAAIFKLLDTSDWTQAIADSPQEVGFTTLMLTVKTFTDSPHVFFGVVACLTVIPAYAVVTRHAIHPALGLTLYVLLAYYVTSFNATRQSLAAALLLLSWTYLGKSRGRFVLITVLAGSIHLSAVFAALALAGARRWHPTLGAGVTLLSLAAVLAVVIDRIPFLADWLSALNPRYGAYLESGETGMGAYLQIAANLALLGFALALRRDELPPRDRQMAVYVLIGIGFMVIGTQAQVLFRMGSYLTIFLILLVPRSIGASKDRGAAALVVLLGATVYYILHVSNYGEVIPYRTFLG